MNVVCYRTGGPDGVRRQNGTGSQNSTGNRNGTGSQNSTGNQNGIGNERRYLAVDDERPVRDMRRFAAVHCDPETGVAPPQAARDTATGRRGADAVLFCSLNAAVRPPRVVTTVVRPDGGRDPECPDAIRCAARWAADRLDEGAGRASATRSEPRPVMVDTPAGTRAARVHPDGSVSVEADQSADPGSAVRGERRVVERTSVLEVAEPGP